MGYIVRSYFDVHLTGFLEHSPSSRLVQYGQRCMATKCAHHGDPMQLHSSMQNALMAPRELAWPHCRPCLPHRLAAKHGRLRPHMGPDTAYFRQVTGFSQPSVSPPSSAEPMLGHHSRTACMPTSHCYAAREQLGSTPRYGALCGGSEGGSLRF